MKGRYWYLICVAALLLSWTSSEKDYPQDYFQLPLNRAIYLSGTFGELRPGHFHAGIDIKSEGGKVGEHVHSSAKGHIARIKVAPGGYGNALYIAHPNGYTTVYAHLDKFTPEIAAYVKAQQYKKERFSVNLYPSADLFPIEQGQHIGFLGNSGGSYGPHLHFEIRRTADQVPVNPFLFGIEVVDDIRPRLDKLSVYYLNENLGQIRSRVYPLIKTKAGQYTLKDTLLEGAWRVGFGIQTIDQMDGVPNKNGVYQVQMSVDGKERYGFKMDEIPFSKTRYLNAHIDYAARQNGLGYFNRCFGLPGNALRIYSPKVEHGVVKLFEKQVQEISIAVNDANGNMSTLTFFVKRDSTMYIPDGPVPTFSTDQNTPLIISVPEFKCVIEKGTFYDETGVTYKEGDATGLYSGMHEIGSESTPLHKYIKISLAAENIPLEHVKKAFVGRQDEDEVVNCGGKYEGDFISTSVRNFGVYTIAIDTIPPTIKAVQFSSDMTGASRMRFEITDDVPTSGKARGLRYTAKVDGKWILMEYDAKKDMLTHWFDGHIDAGDHVLVLRITDDRGNINELKRGFRI